MSDHLNNEMPLMPPQLMEEEENKVGLKIKNDNELQENEQIPQWVLDRQKGHGELLTEADMEEKRKAWQERFIREVENNMPEEYRDPKGQTKKLTDEKLKLHTAAREKAEELLHSRKVFGDSKLMDKVKKAVQEVEDAMHTDGRILHTESINNILGKYRTAITQCRSYVDTKKHNARWEKVKENLDRLVDEAEVLTKAAAMIEAGMIEENLTSYKDVFSYVRLYSLTNGGMLSARPEKREKPTEDRLNGLDKNSAYLYRALSGQEQPSDIIERLSKSKDKEEKAFAKILPGLIENIRGTLDGFQEGMVDTKLFMVGDTLITFTQNTAGQLTADFNGVSIPLEKNTGVLADSLTADILKNENKYSRKDADDIVREMLISAEMMAEEAGDRQLLMTYLVNRSDYKTNDFANFTSPELRAMCSAILLKGKTIRILKESEAAAYQGKQGEILFVDRENKMINIEESKELLKTTQSELNKAEVKSNVTLSTAKNKQGKKEDEWEEKEEKIKNMMSDFVFSYDSWNADEQASKPGERIRQVVLKHIDVFADLIADLYREGADRRKLINSFTDKLPLFMTGDEKGLKAEIRKALDMVVQAIDTELQNRTSLNFRELRNERNFFEAKMTLKDIRREEEAKQREKDEEEGKGEPWYKTIARKATELKEDTADAVEGMAYKASDVMQAHLTDEKALLLGREVDVNGIKINIPSLKEIIEDSLSEDILLEAEDTLNEGVTMATDMISEEISKYTGELFSVKEEEEQKELPDPEEQGITHYEKVKRQRMQIMEGNRKLSKMTVDAIKSGESGQGLFTKLVFENYFSSVSTLDKRSMIGSMIRNAKPVGMQKDEKEKIKVMANVIGGVLKGAGPLFQKMMQGLPTAGIPDELSGAIEDMKSRLAPIPDEIVEAELNNIVERSHHQIQNIKVLKSLGAASVGQTFLCRIKKQDGSEEEVAIKLLKPDARNRMAREKAVMLKCAHMTDVEGRRKDNEKRQQEGKAPLPEIGRDEKGGMEMTYEGQLERIEEELDLTIEARNVELGKIYDKEAEIGDEKVKAMKLSNIAAPTTNSMVLSKAPGETLDGLLKRVKKETDDIRKLFTRGEEYLQLGVEEEKDEVRKKLRREANKKLMEREPYYTGYELAMLKGYKEGTLEFNALQPDVMEKKVMKLLTELKAKKEYLATYAKKWVQEGVFGQGFYHGDPHDGNIMIGDDGLTVIDFGNCTKLTEYQQEHVTRMLSAASIGDMETFRDGFHKLLKPEFEDLYKEKEHELGEVIKKIFKLGDSTATGSRIAVALLEAQKLGLEIPSAVYNFSQGQIRLQNAIDNINAQIRETSKVAMIFNNQLKGIGDNKFDFSENSFNAMVSGHDNTLVAAATAYAFDLLVYGDRPDDLMIMVKDQTGEVENPYINKLRSQMGSTADKAIKSFKDMVKFCKAHTRQERLDPDGKMAGKLNEIKESISFLMDPDMEDEMRDVLFNYDEVREDKAEEIITRLENAKEKASLSVKAFDEVKDIKKRIKKAHEGSFKPTIEEQKEYDDAAERFAGHYISLHVNNARKNDLKDLSRGIALLTSNAPKKKEHAAKEMKLFFAVHPEREAEFMQAYNDYHVLSERLEAKPEGFNIEESYERRAAKRKLTELYHSLIATQVRENYETYIAGYKESTYGFLEIMGDVLEVEWKKLVSRMGFIKSITVGSKFKKQNEKEKELKAEVPDAVVEEALEKI